MNSNFNAPQRQSPIGIILMFTDTVFEIVKSLWFIIVIFFIKSPIHDIVRAGIVVFIALLLLVSFAYLKYKNFTFYIDDENDEFIINHGVLNKSKTIIQLNKLQQVNITQNLLQKIIGVYGIDIETAGSENKEGKIKAINHEIAQQLRQKLLENKNQIKPQNEELVVENDLILSDNQNTFMKLSLWSLIKIGITSNYVKSIGLLITFFFTVYENLHQIGKDDVLNKSNLESITNKTPLYILVFIILLVMIGVNLVRTLVKFYNYNITKKDKSLLLSYGLFNTKSTLLNPSRVQIISISSNYFQKKLNVLELKIKQAIADEHKDKKSLIEIPGCNELEKNQVLELIFNEIPSYKIQLKSNYRKLVFSFFTIIILPVTLFIVINSYVNKFENFQYLAIVYIVFFSILLYFGYKNYRLYISNNFIVKQSGAWDIEKEMVQIDKIQALSTSQLFWHKKLNIGSLTIHTAGGSLNFQLTNYNLVKQYVNLWLYKIETSNSNWM